MGLGVLQQPYLFCAHISFTNNLKTAWNPPPTLWQSTLPIPEGGRNVPSWIVLYSRTAEPSYCNIQHNGYKMYTVLRENVNESKRFWYFIIIIIIRYKYKSWYYLFFLINFTFFMGNIFTVKQINSSIVLYETVHYMDKTSLSYHLKGIAFDYSPFPFYEKSCQIISGQWEPVCKMSSQEKAQSKTSKLLY